MIIQNHDMEPFVQTMASGAVIQLMRVISKYHLMIIQDLQNLRPLRIMGKCFLWSGEGGGRCTIMFDFLM